MLHYFSRAWTTIGVVCQHINSHVDQNIREADPKQYGEDNVLLKILFNACNNIVFIR